MYAFAVVVPQLHAPLMQRVLHGLLLTAVAVVAHAVWNMARLLCPDKGRVAIALTGLTLVLLAPSGTTQLVAMLVGAGGGLLLCRHAHLVAPGTTPSSNVRTAWVALTLLAGLMIALLALARLQPHGPFAITSVFYNAGALVFGGGHVVLPLLRQALVPAGWLSDQSFLAGYGFAQALPGPLFTVAAYLGAASAPQHASALWAVLAVAGIFTPGLLCAVAGQSLLQRIKQFKIAPPILAGVNGSVVGILGAALYNPVFVSAVHSGADAVVAVGSLALLHRRLRPVIVTLLCVAASLLFQ